MGAEPAKGGGPGAERRQAANAGAVGIQFTGTILAFLFAGRWLDGRLGTEPWLLLVGVFVGFVLGTLWIYRRLLAGTGEGAGR